MRNTLRKLWAAAPIATGLVIGAGILACLFAVHLLISAAMWQTRDAGAQAQIEPWMTPRFVARSWMVEREVVIDALELDDPQGDKRTRLKDLADTRGLRVETLIDTLEAAIESHRAAHPERDDWTQKDWRRFQKAQEQAEREAGQ